MSYRMHWRFAVTMAWSVGIIGCSNHAPALFPIGNQEVVTGQTLEIDVHATDEDGDPLKYGIKFDPVTKPGNATFKEQEGGARFSWTPLASDAGPEGKGQDFPITFMVTDGVSTSSERVIITVGLGGAGAGAPRLVSPRDYTLDLNRNDTIKMEIEVRDEASSNVTLRLMQGIDGAQFSSKINNDTGSIVGSFQWTPSKDQISQKPIWSIRVGAKDDKNPEQVWDITILIKGGKKTCSGDLPIVDHQPLADQYGGDDYPIAVTATDGDSNIASVTLHWNREEAEGDFQQIPMTNSSGDTWIGMIPNAQLTGEQTEKISYFICAKDNDDPKDGVCNQQTCAPDKVRYSFIAHAPGNENCANDMYEGNDTPTYATPLSFTADGFSYSSDLTICPGDEDWYRLDLEAGYEMPAYIVYAQAEGDLTFFLYDQDATTLLYSGQGFDSDGLWTVGFWVDAVAQAKTYYLRVQGSDPQVKKNLYELVAGKRPECDKPNNVSSAAEPITPTTTPLEERNCGNTDWYKIDLQRNDYWTVDLAFTRDNGDFDMALMNQATALGLYGKNIVLDDALCFGPGVRCFRYSSRDTALGWNVAKAAGAHYLAVVPISFLGNDYSLTTEVEHLGDCTDDSNEPNDAPAQATQIANGACNVTLCPDNEDWYRAFVANSGDVLDIKLILDADFNGAYYGLALYRYNVVNAHTPREMDDIHKDYLITFSIDTQLTYTTDYAGDYYIRLFVVKDSFGQYSLELSPGACSAF